MQLIYFILLFFLGQFARSQNTFTNPVLDTLSADPAVLKHGGFYYMSLSTDSDTTITILRSSVLTNFRDAERKVVFNSESVGLKGLWAPEIHQVEGNIYVYFCMDNGDVPAHRMYVIQALDQNDPLGNWGSPIRMITDVEDFSIDGTVMKHGDNDKLYFIWAGILRPTSLFIAPMVNPVTVGESKLLLRAPTADWEQIGTPTVEGPYCFYNNSMTFMAFSVGSTWTPDYSMGLMSIPSHLDPMIPSNWWYGIHGPVFYRNDEESVFTTGHASFTLSPDETETWMVYHASNTTEDPVNHRIARLEKIEWDQNGNPIFPRPHGFNSPIPVPSVSNYDIRTWRNLRKIGYDGVKKAMCDISNKKNP